MAKSAALRRAALALALAIVPGFSTAQSPGPLSTPDIKLLKNGSILAVERLADGSTIVGGIFDSIDGLPRQGLARVLPDGTVDPAWNPAPGGSVNAIVADDAGDIYVGGSFTNVGTASRQYAAKIRATGTGEVLPWNPSADGPVVALALDGDGAIYVGGRFENIGGHVRHKLAKLSADTGEVDAQWVPATRGDGDVDDITDIRALAASDGTLYVGGYYTRIGEAARRNLARISTGGTGIADPQWNPSPDGVVQALALGNEAVYAAGYFGQAGGRIQRYLTKLGVTGAGAADADWNPEPELDGSPFVEIKALALDANGDLYAGGRFSRIDGQARSNIAKLSGNTGAPVADWNPGTNGVVMALDVDAQGNLRIGGSFLRAADRQAWGYAAVAQDGSPAAALDAQYPGVVYTLAPLPGGGAVVGGQFESANGQLRGNLLRLRPDGTLDPDWKPMADDYVRALAVTGDSIYAGGNFTRVDAMPRSRLVKLDGAAATVDVNWAPDPDNVVSSLAVADDALFAGGLFWNVGQREQRHLAKLPLTGTALADATWNPAPDGSVDALLAGAQGELYVGGSYSIIGGLAKPRLARVATSGTGVVSPEWAPFEEESTYGVATLAPGPSDTLYVAGHFTKAGGLPRTSVARVSKAGAGETDPDWNPQLHDDWSSVPWVGAVSADRTGTVYLAGIFNQAGGLSRMGLVRVSASTGMVDAGWNPAPDRYTRALAVMADGSILAGGEFSTVGATSRGGMAAFDDAERIFANGFEPD